MKIVENYITEEQEEMLLNFVENLEFQSVRGGKRVACHFGYKYDYSAYRCDPALPIPQELVFEDIFEAGNINQLIINRYLPGEGIGRHTDLNIFGEKIYCISIGSGTTVIFNGLGAEGRPPESYYIPRRSLYIMEGYYRDTTHEIAKRKTDMVEGNRLRRGTRYSLTYRNFINAD